MIPHNSRSKYPINFKQSGKRFLLSLHYYGSNSFLFVNATKIYKFKAKDSKIKDYALCLGNISKDFTINNMEKKKKAKKTKQNRIKRNCNFFSVDFSSIDTNDISDIHKYLMKKT